MPDRALVEAFIATVVSGRHAEAIEDFYAEDASMQENHGAPRVGRDVLVAHERAFLARMAKIVTHPVERWLLDGDRVVINWVFEVTDKDGVTRRLDELAIQLWGGDKIVREQFYYDPGALTLSDSAHPGECRDPDHKALTARAESALRQASNCGAIRSGSRHSPG
ncbi:MAG TPA: nuclear transport factor 2 family protein [Caulobacteraceae bacterium]|jgi:hypothetical protein